MGFPLLFWDGREKYAFRLGNSEIKEKSRQGLSLHGRPTFPLRNLHPACNYLTAAYDSTDHSHLFETCSFFILSLGSGNIRLSWFSSCLVGCSCSVSNAGSSSLCQTSDWLCPHPNGSDLSSLFL